MVRLIESGDLMIPQSAEPITIQTYFPTLQAFNLACRQDKALTPPAQLLFRLLIEQANSSRWTDSFTLSVDEIEAITHLARHTIVDARRILKNKGYIDFSGNPSRYIVYSAVHCELHRDSSPTPPIKIPKYNTKRKRKEKEKEVKENVPDNPPNTEQLNALINERIAALESNL